jgi:WD40 repeat protein
LVTILGFGAKNTRCPNPLLVYDPPASLESEDGIVRVTGHDIGDEVRGKGAPAGCGQSSEDYVPAGATPYGSFVIANRGDGTTMTVDPEPFPPLGWRGHAAFVPGSHDVVLGWVDKMVTVDGDTMEITATRLWDERGALPMAWLKSSPDGRSMVGTGAHFGGDPDIEIFDPHTLEMPVRIETAHAGTITGLDVSQDGARLVSGSRDEWVRVWSWEDQDHTHAIRAPGPVHGVAFADNDRHVIVTLEDGHTCE